MDGIREQRPCRFLGEMGAEQRKENAKVLRLEGAGYGWGW